jgi:hypothetical protein
MSGKNERGITHYFLNGLQLSSHFFPALRGFWMLNSREGMPILLWRSLLLLRAFTVNQQIVPIFLELYLHTATISLYPAA